MRLRKILTAVIIFILLCPATAYADEPYNNYNYDFWGTPVPAPAAYLPSRIIDGRSLGTYEFRKPQDLFTGPDNKLYVADTGNNRIVVINEYWELDRIIDGFDNNGSQDTFNNPQGLFVTNDGEIYVADTSNSRIVHLDADGNLIRIIGRPVSDIIPADLQYYPTALVVDKAGRIYIIAQGVNQGLIELDNQGEFVGYVGATKVKFNMVDYFWKLIATDEQRERMQLFVPTEYNNIDIDTEGFLYVTTSSLALEDIDRAINTRSKDDRYAPIRKLNPTGTDVLRRNGYFPPVGDVYFRSRGYAESGNSQLYDVCVEDSGIYSVLDKKKGRIFTYDTDGNLLYLFGGIGNRLGNFRDPAALDTINDQFVVLDSNMGQVTVFEPTLYGQLVKEAVVLHLNGRYDESAAKWEQVLKYNANSELAYIGMGKAYLRKDEFRLAMKYFKLGNKRDYYSKAFDLYRQEVIGDNFGWIVITILVLLVGSKILKKVRARKKAGIKAMGKVEA
ncbi:MAG TPA: gluconolactonase [Clostridia bacterium]